MYRSFFSLQLKPFDITTDPLFLWQGEKHKTALETLRYGIEENKGFLLLTGDAGTGKTTLINALTKNLGQGVAWALISDPQRERLDFYNAIAKGFGIVKEFTSKVQFLIQFSHFLHKAEEEKKRVLLLVDDCHLLSQEMLEELRLLSNIEKDEAKLINIFFVGQHEFKDMLIQPNNRAVRQRLSLKVELASLTARETGEYICHRLKVAGTEERLFSEKAVQMIHRYSQGIPRRINIICDHALVAASVQGKRSIDTKTLLECIEKLNLPLLPSQEDFEGLDDEKSHLEHFRGRFTPGSAQQPTTVSGVNLEGEGHWNWLKYPLGGAVVAFVSVYLWYQSEKIHETPKVEPLKTELQVVHNELPPVKSSPVVTALEQHQTETNDKKAEALQHVILEKAYGNGENIRQGATPQDATGRGQVEAGAMRDRDARVNLGESIPAIKTAEQTAKVPEQATGSPAAVDGKGKIPVLPSKVILPLAPNSMKLTAEAEKEFKAFVDKLKSYPEAKLLVKGFVSSNSDSPENIKMSEERAMVVQKLLVARGVETARIQVKGMGNQEPIASNDTIDGRTKNRRVEIVVVEK